MPFTVLTKFAYRYAASNSARGKVIMRTGKTLDFAQSNCDSKKSSLSLDIKYIHATSARSEASANPHNFMLWDALTTT